MIFMNDLCLDLKLNSLSLNNFLFLLRSLTEILPGIGGEDTFIVG